MKKSIYSVITGTGSYIPTEIVKNEDFLSHEFHEANGAKIAKVNKDTIDMFFKITTIGERRYITDDLVTSDIASLAAKEAIKSAGIDKEELDQVIVAHNFGDVKMADRRPDMVPSLAARVKQKLGIANPATVAYDVIFGCPGWLQAVIQADAFIRSGEAKKVLVIGAEALSRVSDPHDRDSMLYADGAGAIILEATESEEPIGILGHSSRSDALDYAGMLTMGPSYNSSFADKGSLFLKMEGHRLYKYALKTVPESIRDCMVKCGVSIEHVKKVLIHQANGKMDEAILKRLYALYDTKPPKHIMPMTVDWLGNSSVATLPTLLDLISKHKMTSHELKKGDDLIFASVGAGMNINAMVYRMN